MRTCECALSNLRKHWPVRSRHTLILPSVDPDATISLSLLMSKQSTASSCIMNASSAWYCRSFFSFPER